jgi:hypothetical protein
LKLLNNTTEVIQIVVSDVDGDSMGEKELKFDLHLDNSFKFLL